MQTVELKKQKPRRLTNTAKRLILGEEAYAKAQALSLADHKKEERRLRYLLLWLSVAGIMGIVLFGWIRILYGTYSGVEMKGIFFNETSIGEWKQSLFSAVPQEGEKKE